MKTDAESEEAVKRLGKYWSCVQMIFSPFLLNENTLRHLEIKNNFNHDLSTISHVIQLYWSLLSINWYIFSDIKILN